MTIEEIRKLEAGPELDALIDRHIFKRDKTTYCETFQTFHCDGKSRVICGACGHTGHGNCYGNGEGQISVQCANTGCQKNYSSNIAAAWLVVEKMIGEFHQGDIHIEHLNEEWNVSSCYNGIEWKLWTAHKDICVAICRAALIAVTREVE